MQAVSPWTAIASAAVSCVPSPAPLDEVRAGPGGDLRTVAADHLEGVLARRRSWREFASVPLAEHAVARLAWAAQGVSDAATGHRTAPSAGGLYALDLFVAEARGLRRYNPRPNQLSLVSTRDVRADLAAAAHGQAFVARAPLVMVLVGFPQRLRARYGHVAERFTLLEVGHAAQNALLAATALGLGSVPVGALDDEAALQALGLPPGEEAVAYLVAVGATR